MLFYEGVQSSDWGDPAYWHPDEGADQYKKRWGFPSYPGLLDQVALPFRAQGCRLPWLACRGNHDELVAGTVAPGGGIDAILTGACKPRQLSPGSLFRLQSIMDDPALLIFGPARDPELFLGGPSHPVTPDAERRTFNLREFVLEHMRAGGAPVGHGFTHDNLAAGTAYYVVDDYDPVRLIVLDTANPAGHYDGSIGAGQYEWLQEQLIESHSSFYAPGGELLRTAHRDRLIVLCSHHGAETLTNPASLPPSELDRAQDLPRVLRSEIMELLHRFPNVILWLNGHTHNHAIRARADPSRRTAGFWEVTTGSLLDWPCQSREIELVSEGDGTISIFCTLVDHAAAADPTNASGIWQLAAIHRELAANDPHAGIRSGFAGTIEDRTVELVVPEPFAIRGNAVANRSQFS